MVCAREMPLTVRNPAEFLQAQKAQTGAQLRTYNCASMSLAYKKPVIPYGRWQAQIAPEKVCKEQENRGNLI